jgi:hypothetical protein
MLTGIFSTLLLPETVGQSLEVLSNEDQDNFVTRKSWLFLSCRAPSDFFPRPLDKRKT